ncbi:hypothetical protein AHF37_11012, partial [Paragonimus kellicotti]
DLLSSALAPVGVTWMACPACTELEVITLDWLVQALGLPEKFLSTCSRMDCLHRGGGAIEVSNFDSLCLELRISLERTGFICSASNDFHHKFRWPKNRKIETQRRIVFSSQ